MTTSPELLRAASRTFAIGIERLPPALCRPIRTSYLLLRVSDYLEDNEEMEPAHKRELLLLWERILRGDAGVAELEARLRFAAPLTPDARVAAHTRLVLEELALEPAAVRDIIVRHVADSTRGMARWAERGPRIADEADLDDYMHEVAGRVGYLLTELFVHFVPGLHARRDEMMRLGREFGLGLQTINVIRGLAGDRERGWIFVPDSYAAAEGLPREALFEPEHREAALRVLERLVAKAARHMERAREYVERIPRRQHRIRLFCLLPLFFGVRTLAVSRGNPAVFTDEAKIGRDAVRRITRSTAVLGWSNAWVRRYARRLAVVE